MQESESKRGDDAVIFRPTVNAIHPLRNWKLALYQAKSCDGDVGECTYPPYAEVYADGRNQPVAEMYNLAKRYKRSASLWQTDDEFVQMCFDACMDSNRLDAKDENGEDYHILNTEHNEATVDDDFRERYSKTFRPFRELYESVSFTCLSVSVVEDLMNRPVHDMDVYESAKMHWMGTYRPVNISRPSGSQKRLMCILSDIAYSDQRTIPVEWETPSSWNVYTRLQSDSSFPFSGMLGGAASTEEAVLGGTALQMERSSRVYDRAGWEYWSLYREYGNRLYTEASEYDQKDAYVVTDIDSKANCICKPLSGTQEPQVHVSTELRVCGNNDRRASASGDGTNVKPEAYPELLDNLYSRCYMSPSLHTSDREHSCTAYADPPVYGDGQLCTFISHALWSVDCFPTFGVCSEKMTRAECERSPQRKPMCFWYADHCQQRYVTCEALRYDAVSLVCRGDERACVQLGTSSKCNAEAGCIFANGSCHELVDYASDCVPTEFVEGSACNASEATQHALRNIFYPDKPVDGVGRRLHTEQYTEHGIYKNDPVSVPCGGSLTPNITGVLNISARFVTCDPELSIAGYRADVHKAYVVDGFAHPVLHLSLKKEYAFRMHRTTSSNPVYSLDESVVGYNFVAVREATGFHSTTASDSVQVASPLVDYDGIAFPHLMRGSDEYYYGTDQEEYTPFKINMATLVQNNTDLFTNPRSLFQTVANVGNATTCVYLNSTSPDATASCCELVVADAFSQAFEEFGHECVDPSLMTSLEHLDDRLSGDFVYYGLPEGCHLYNTHPKTLYSCGPECAMRPPPPSPPAPSPASTPKGASSASVVSAPAQSARTTRHTALASTHSKKVLTLFVAQRHMCASLNSISEVCTSDDHTFDESLLCDEVKYASGASMPFEFYYADAHEEGMGGQLLLYVDEVPESTYYAATLSPQAPSTSDTPSFYAYIASSEPTNDEASYSNVYGDDVSEKANVADRIASTYKDIWNNTYDTLEEFHVSVYHVVRYDLANDLASWARARFPAVAEILLHGVRVYAEIIRGVLGGTVYLGNRLAHGERASGDVMWRLIDPIFQEYMAVSSSFFDYVHFFMNPVQSYKHRSAKVLCKASDVPNHILSGSLKISATVATAATFPVGTTGESVGCNPTVANCSNGFYALDTSLNLNPICAITAVLENPNVGSDSMSKMTNMFNTRGASGATVIPEGAASYAGLDNFRFSFGSVSLVRYIRNLFRYILGLVIDSLNCVMQAVGVSGEDPDAHDCVAFLSDLSYPTFVINTLVTVTFESQVHMANLLASLSSFVWSFVYVAAKYDPALYSTVSTWPKDASFAAMLPPTMCAGLPHAQCVAQGLGEVTSPGKHTFRWKTVDNEATVVHGCDREWCHCAWVITEDNFDNFQGEGQEQYMYHRSYLTGDKQRITPSDAEAHGFAGFDNDTIRYYRQSVRGVNVTEYGYLGDPDAVDAYTAQEGRFPYWLFSPGACVSACDLTTDKKSCSREFTAYTPSAYLGTAPPFVRVGCTHSSRYGCATNSHHIQPYPLEAATSTLFVAFMSGAQRAAIATNLTAAYLFDRFLLVAEGTVASNNVEAMFGEIVEDSAAMYYLVPYMYAQTQTLLYFRDILVAVLEFVRALAVVLNEDSDARFLDFQREVLDFMMTLEDLADMAGAFMMRLIDDLVRLTLELCKICIELLQFSGDASMGSKLLNDVVEFAEIALDLIYNFGSAVYQMVYRFMAESSFGKQLLSLVEGVCHVANDITDAVQYMQSGLCSFLDQKFTSFKLSKKNYRIAGVKLTLPDITTFPFRLKNAFGSSLGHLVYDAFKCDCPSAKEMARNPDRYTAKKYTGCLKESSCKMPSVGSDTPYRPMEASQCQTSGLDKIRDIHTTSLLPEVGHNDWETHCSMCWATSEAFCMETRTGGEDSNGARGGVFDSYGTTTHTTSDTMTFCARHTKEAACVSEKQTELHLSVCVWDPYFFGDSEDATLRASPGKCLGRRTVKNEYYGQPCVCERCRGGVFCGASGFCQCGVLPSLTLGLECQPSMTLSQMGNVTIYARHDGDASTRCGSCPSDGARALTPSGSHYNSVCYVRQAEFCMYNNRMDNSGIESAEPQTLTRCLEDLEVFGPVLCRNYCDSSVMNDNNLLFHKVSLNYSTHSSLNLYSSLAMQPEDIPNTEFCTCDLNLRAVYMDGVAHGESTSTLDISVDTNGYTASVIQSADDEDAESKRRRRLRRRLLGEDEDEWMARTSNNDTHAETVREGSRARNDTSDENRTRHHAATPVDSEWETSASSNLSATRWNNDTSLSLESMRHIFSVFRDESDAYASLCSVHADCAVPEAICSQVTYGDQTPVLCASCERDTFSWTEAERRCDSRLGHCACGRHITDIVRDTGRDVTVEKWQNVTLAFLANLEMWTGDSLCDKLFRELVRSNPRLDMSEASLSDRVNVDRCIEMRVMGLRARTALNLTTLPVDIVYNQLRWLDLLREMVTGIYVREIGMSDEDARNRTRVLSALERSGVDPALYLDVRERVGDSVGPMYRSILDAVTNTSRNLLQAIERSSTIYNLTSSEQIASLADSVREKYARAVNNGGVVLRHVSKSRIKESVQRLGAHAVPVAWEAAKIVRAIRSTYLKAVHPVEGPDLQRGVEHYYRLQYDQTWHVEHDNVRKNITDRAHQDESEVSSSADDSAASSAGEHSPLGRVTAVRAEGLAGPRPRRPYASAVATSRRLLQSSSSLEESQLSNSRSESCDVYEEVTDLIRNVTTFATSYYRFASSGDAEYPKTHTFQRSLCTYLKTLRLIHPDDASDDGIRFCNTDPYNNRRTTDGRGVFTIIYQEYLLDIRSVLSLSDTFRRAETDKRYDITHTRVSNRSRVSDCTNITPTTFFVCLTELVFDGLSIDFDFDTDVTDVLVNEVWQDKAREGDIEVRSIDEISFYDTEFEGLWYPSDSRLLNSELLPKGNVRFGMQHFRYPIGNWPRKRSTWRTDTGEREYFRSWYEHWRTYDFSQRDGSGAVISDLPLNYRSNYELVDFFLYKESEPDASWWTTDFYEEIGLVPAHILMGMCEIREAAQESVQTNVGGWCGDEQTRSLVFGAEHATRWRELGYGPHDDLRLNWYKVPFGVTSFRFDLAKQRAYGLLRAGVDYPIPLHRIMRDASLTRADVNRISAEDIERRCVILRLDIHEDNFFDNATVRRSAYRCVCSSYVDADELDKCLEDERCIAPKRSFFSLRGYTELPDFVYDNGGWWDCRSVQAGEELPCTPMPSPILRTVANVSSRGHEYELLRHVASTTNRSPRYNELIACEGRDDTFPFLCTMLANVSLALVGIVFFKIVFGMQSVETSMIGGAAVLIATHLALRTSYGWELAFYPAVPTCLADDLAHDLERYLLPRHLEWPSSWATRNLENDRLYGTVDCSADPYGFRDGIRNAFYLWRRHHPSSMNDVCADRRTAWLCESFQEYFRYYDEYDTPRTAEENGHDNVDDMIDVFDACQLRTILNFVPAVTVVFIAMTAAATASSLLVGTGVAGVMVVLNLRTFVQYMVMYINVKIHILTTMVAQES
ncbi:hypothetical protein CYMTET_3694 [Cymbomonas tetramitiformis]|uniref:Uncharacterized protein n=1 Tax=Cymbomonas tetramitiformis TaxID=36881 RepID=A0AAE0H360_9CHLO|nr:hypothetical protein CYMTET_3694 [Cymbomonas tetramitiformis]